jgi:hypothetical protein
MDRWITLLAERLAVHLVAHGSDGLVIAGTTGESPTLTWEEEYELFRVVKTAVGERAQVLAGTGANSTREAVAATVKAAELGLDGSLQVVPYYNKPPQAGLLAHFSHHCPGGAGFSPDAVQHSQSHGGESPAGNRGSIGGQRGEYHCHQGSQRESGAGGAVAAVGAPGTIGDLLRG